MANRESVSALSGHNSKTVKTNYIMHERMKDVQNAAAFMEAVQSEPMVESPVRTMLLSQVPAVMASGAKASRPAVEIDLDNVIAVARSQVAINTWHREKSVNEPEPTSTEDIIAGLPWGTKHPDRSRGPQQRARWTPFEVEFIGQWCDKAKAEYPTMTQMISKCRDSLATEYTHMIEHFHVNHVITTSRFTHGYRLYNTRNGLL
jgi:hypothetical protein